MNTRASAWSVTMNMKNIPKDKCEEYIGRARQNNWSVEGQIEEGEQGTQHYQLLVRTPQVRFSAVKKMFPTAHIEVCRNVSALKNYVHKEETRIEEVRQVENKYVTWKDVRTRFFEWLQEETCEYDDVRKLVLWDKFICESVAEGIECDVIGVNPQYRSCIVKYWDGYVMRQNGRQSGSVDKSQTDRQEVSLPMYYTQDADGNQD